MARGDHLIVPLVCGTTHHGIDVGDGTVIHWSGIWRSVEDTVQDQLFAKQNGMIRQESLDQFARGLAVSVRHYENSLSPDEVVTRAQSRLGEKGYDLTRNNCEHFACWCKTDRHHSSQVWIAHRVVHRTAAMAARLSASRAAKMGIRSLTRSATPWLLAAEGAQLVTELTAAQIKPHAPEQAEKLGRRVGLVASMGVGALTGTIAGPVGVAIGAMTGAGTWIASDQAGQRVANWIQGRVSPQLSDR
jgi:hypothetical protein